MSEEKNKYKDMASRCKCCDKILNRPEIMRGFCYKCNGKSFEKFNVMSDHEYHHQDLTEGLPYDTYL